VGRRHAGARRRVFQAGLNVSPTILTYHSIDPSGSVISTTPELFARQMELLAGLEIPVVPLPELPATPGAVAITFDDAYRNFRTAALPVLASHSLPATVFAVADYCGRTNDWLGDHAAIPRLPLMDSNELRELHRAGIAIGSHTLTHPVLPELPKERIAEELSHSRRRLEEWIGAPVETVAYPYGACSAAVRRIAREHYRIGCGTRLWYVEGVTDPLELPRIDSFYLKNLKIFERVLNQRGRTRLRFRRLLRETRQWATG